MHVGRSAFSKFLHKMTDPKDLDQIIADAGAPEVEKRKYFYLDNEGNLKESTLVAPIVAKDDGSELGAPSPRYGVVQYKDSVEFIREVVTKGQLVIEFAALTNNRARLHLMGRSQMDDIDLGEGDSIKMYSTISTSQDGSGKVTCRLTPVHTASETVFTPFGNSQIGIRHSVHVQNHIAQALKMLRRVKAEASDFATSAKMMLKRNVTDAEAFTFFVSVFEGESQRAANIRNKCYDIFKTHQIGTCKGTVFGLLIAIQTYVDRYKTVRKSKRQNEIEATVEAVLTGDGARLKAQGYATALTLLRDF